MEPQVLREPNFVLLISGYLHQLQSSLEIHIPWDIVIVIQKFYPLSHKIKYHDDYTVPGVSSTEWDKEFEHVFKSLTISEFGSMRLNKYEHGSLIITVLNDLTLCKYGVIQVNGNGYNGGKYGKNGCSAYNKKYGGQGAITDFNCGGGGGYTTKGMNGDDYDDYDNYISTIAMGGDAFDTNMSHKYLYGGSGGGGSKVGQQSRGGNGGGIILLRVYGCLNLNESSSIEANGETGSSSRDGSGSGGSIMIYCNTLKMNKHRSLFATTMNKIIESKGGKVERGASGWYGGDGGLGKILIYCHNNDRLTFESICSPKPYFC